MKTRSKSITGQLLLALVPYSKPNLKLTFRPTEFFSDLERLTGSNRESLASTFSRAKRQGKINFTSGRPQLTAAGLSYVQPVQQQLNLPTGSWLIVIFDIPEDRASSRQRLRRYLRSLGFQQIQKSVWASPNQCTDEVTAAVSELNLSRHVKIIIGRPVFPSLPNLKNS